MFEIGSTPYIIGLAVLSVAGFTQGLTGSGYAIVAVPVLINLFPPQGIVPMMLIHGSLVSTAILFQTYRHIDLKRIWLLFPGSIIGMPVGVI